MEIYRGLLEKNMFEKYIIRLYFIFYIYLYFIHYLFHIPVLFLGRNEGNF